jgi:hypothetical protein
MTTKTIKLIAFLALLVHGIGHFQGVAAGLGVKINKGNPAQSWLLRGLDQKLHRTLCIILFLLTGIFGIITAISFWGLLLPEAWQILAVVTALFSTICLILYPNSFAMFFNKVGAIAVNLIIYYSIAFNQNWPAALFEE